MYDDQYDEIRRMPSRNPMSTAAVTFGIMSLLCCYMFYIALPCGALAVIFAILSRSSRPMPGKSRAGLICGLCGMAATVIVTAAAVYTVFTDAQMRAYMEHYLQIYTGDYDLKLDEILPFLSEQGGTDPENSDSGSEEEQENDDNSYDNDTDDPADNGRDFIADPPDAAPDAEGVFI